LLHPAVRAAIRTARHCGVLVVIVTGRILSELRDVAGALDFVDGVVAENGAVISLAGGHCMQLGQSPPISFLTATRNAALISKSAAALSKWMLSFRLWRCR